ncbi:MAG: lysine--tRNA ligase [archaeon]|nr:lysine--tRNA ligase [archaeon]
MTFIRWRLIGMHWADVIAEKAVEECEHPIIAAGISPTGILHVGSLREAVTGESVCSVLRERGYDVKLVYFVDSFDPLRRRYEFLPKEFEKYVGMPICNIPCPCGKHDNYADHFIQPLFDVIKQLKMECDVIWTHKLYGDGRFAETINLSIERRKEVMDILEEISGRNKTFIPYSPLCEECGRFSRPIFETYRFPYIEYECTCGHIGKADVRKMEGKLPWRLEWPAKWKIFGVTVEPFGKDHAASGGSYDTSKEIVKKIFGGKAPYPVPYEFVQLKGVGQMHKSTGSPITALDAVRITPPEILNYLFLRVNPHRSIEYDSGTGVLEISDEYDRMETLYFDGNFTETEENSVRAYEIAQHNKVSAVKPLQIAYRHLANIVQVAEDFEDVVKIIERTKNISVGGADVDKLKLKCDCVKHWIEKFAPDVAKFSICESVPALELSEDDRALFASLIAKFTAINWRADEINGGILDSSKEINLNVKNSFRLLYRVFIGKSSGPRIGTFFESMNRNFVIKRLREASALCGKL